MGKTYIITGVYGSGKTEFCVNLALRLARSGGSVTIADMDVINPYFRSREREDDLADAGIEIIGSSISNKNIQDLPAISFGFISRIRNRENVIIDLAGGENGLKLLARCYEAICDYEFLCVFNPFRPETVSAEQMVNFAKTVNSLTKLPLTGFVNNGNLLRETTAEHVLYAQSIIKDAAQQMNLPIKYTLLQSDIRSKIAGNLLSDDVIIFDELQMRKSWQ